MTDSAPAKTTDKTPEEMAAECQAKPQAEHAWLTSLAGEWAFEAECFMGPDQPPMKHSGTETVRAVGDLWIIGEGAGDMPGGGDALMRLTLGYDPARGCFVGNWVGSMMTHMFVYTGSLDDARRTLTLDTEGPSFNDPTTTARYRETMEIVDDNHRIFRSSTPGPDGEWMTFMTAHYRRAT